MNIDAEIRRECERRGYFFDDWQTHPADATGSCPHAPGTGEAERWRRAQALRWRLIRELRG